MAAETTLYAAVKAFLEAQGFSAKGEIGNCDIVAVRAGEPPLLVICELKLGFNLELLLQANRPHGRRGRYLACRAAHQSRA